MENKKCYQCKKLLNIVEFSTNEKIYSKCNHCRNSLKKYLNKCEICGIRAYFNYTKETNGIRCKTHSLPNMIDIKSKKCEKCRSKASYGYCGQSVTRCAQHRVCDKMFVRSKRTCRESGCEDIAMYGKIEPEWCFIHKKSDDISLTCKKCKRCCREDEILDNNDLCLEYCTKEDIFDYVKRRVKKQEEMVLRYLSENIEYKYSDEENINANNIGKQRNRPDRMYRCKNHILMIEVDEKQHKDRKCVIPDSEIARMYDIGSRMLEDEKKSTIFIRFNPDKYKVDGKQTNYSMPKRLELLVKWVNYFLNEYEPKTDNDQVKYIKLFFDDFHDGNIEIQEIDGIKIMKNQNK